MQLICKKILRTLTALGLLAVIIPEASANILKTQGSVEDSSGAAIPGADILAVLADGSMRRSTTSDYAGKFQLEVPSPGEYTVTVSRAGFAVSRFSMVIGAGELAPLVVVLQPAVLAQEIAVAANLIAGTPEVVSRTPGSVEVISPDMLRQTHAFSFDEALRKAAGVYARPEEGFSLRPNISIRGLDPTRSRRVLLLEDGIPLAYAPYGDNASYYHPPVDRFDSIEVVKGSGQVAYGPMTVGGVVNYVTPPIPDAPAGSLSLTGGNRGYGNAHLRYGGMWKGSGLLFDAVRKQGHGARDNVRSGLNDANFKLLTTVSGSQALSLKANYYGEDSRVTYTGLRLNEWLDDPRQNPFRNDEFIGRRWGASATHVASLGADTTLTTNLYGSIFHRDWWRQSSNSGQRPNRAAEPACGGMANLLTTCGNEGRLRKYNTWGIDPRLRWNHRFLGARSELDAGFRAHFERQERLQMNGSSPLARTGLIVEDNQRTNQAYSGYIQNRFHVGAWSLTPGMRLEHVRYRRLNRLFNSGQGVSGSTSLTQAIPGFGAAWNPRPGLTVFAGIHRGFAPPRTEDIINNAGGYVELDSELSWSKEVGFRARIRRGLSLESTFFRMDYSNQIIPANLAGGVGAALTSAGRTMHQGLEVTGRYEIRDAFGSGNNFFLRGAWTWLPVARFEDTRYSAVSGFRHVLITGNRLPYASRSLLNASVGWTGRSGINALLEAVQTGSQFGDDLNTVNPTPDGQRGVLPGHVLWNATLNVPLEARRTSLFFTVKNVFDRLVLVDRVRGMIPGSPRLAQAGLRFQF